MQSNKKVRQTLRDFRVELIESNSSGQPLAKEHRLGVEEQCESDKSFFLRVKKFHFYIDPDSKQEDLILDTFPSEALSNDSAVHSFNEEGEESNEDDNDEESFDKHGLTSPLITPLKIKYPHSMSVRKQEAGGKYFFIAEEQQQQLQY